MAAPQRQRYEITKYPNRRFYDITSRRHVTLSDLHDLVRAGHEIVVTEKDTGRDITNVVLTQIILEHDPPKMDLFPSSMLHQAIQMNETMARSFIDQYLARAMNAFSKSRQQFDDFLRQTGIPGVPPVAPPMDWLRMLIPGMAGQAPHRTTDDATPRTESEPPPTSDESAAADNRDAQIEALQRQIAHLGEQFAQLRAPAAPKPAPKRKKKIAKKKRKANKK